MLLRALLLLAAVAGPVFSAGDLSRRVIYAINCGGPEHIGYGGIVYSGDEPVSGTVDSGHGARYAFRNGKEEDAALYQTERFALQDFTYRFPVKEGQFVLILKFSEVYFQKPGQKVFDVRLNGITVVRDLDIFAETGAVGYALDKYVEFRVEDGKIHAAGQSRAVGHSIEVTLAKGAADNPKINAIAILKGNQLGLPALPSPTFVEEETKEEVDKWQNVENVAPPPVVETHDSDDHDVANGPRSMNPYDQMEDPFKVTLLLLAVVLIPIIYLLHKM